MKVNSHLIGYAAATAFILGYFWWTPKEIEIYLEYRIFKAKGKFKVERLRGTMDQNPTFSTIEEAKTWITAQVALAKVRSAIPWGQ